MSAITTHVLDTSRGWPAVGVAVVLERRAGGREWERVGKDETDADGRARNLLPADTPLALGIYRMTFDTGRYFAAQSVKSLYPTVVIVFEVVGGESHYHVPLLLSPHGYTTYRGT
jgi:5-hydroxyisourate hydrolase